MAHFLLAVKYHKIATETPAILDGLPMQEKTACSKVAYWVGMIGNTLSGPAYTVTGAIFYN